ncbi:BON domain-containing protein [Massilia consociata]
MNVARICRAAMLSATLVALGACSTDPNTRKVGVALSDTAISTRVKTALLGDPDVKGRNVNVETFRGTVQLSGFVDNPESVARAADIARRVDGVREVRNALIVK